MSDGTYRIKDLKGRVLLEFKNGQIAIARYPTMSESCKQYMVNVCSQVTDWDVKKLREFLDYNTETNEFCS